MDRLAGKTAIVTGATQGIGEAVARRLHLEGAHVVVVARSVSEEHAVVRGLGKRVSYCRGSVDDPATAAAAVAIALKTGRLDILVNNAGLDLTGDVLATDEAEVRRVFDTNFFGALWMLQAAGTHMAAVGQGSIINITSRLASIGVPTMSLYGASKGALLALTRGSAIDLALTGVRVNAVAPGFTETPLMTAWSRTLGTAEDGPRAVKAQIPQGRLGTPEDVAAICAFLAADESAHITGASIPVDGGYTAA